MSKQHEEYLLIIEQHYDKNQLNKLRIPQLKRAIKHMTSYADTCTDCREQLVATEEHLHTLVKEIDQTEKQDLKVHVAFVNHIVKHLEKEHKLVTEGYYMSIFMSIGMSIGLVLGLTLLDNIALGLPIGMSIGLAVGIGLDADAAKKGKQI
ncbi:hypothetical protein SAMN04488134_101279 [Amphibacillus marinus]|uniref:Uncharacterized protein n=1 Tax=Amphibacillus marinus TaxID=872970 RepID=A0A1H8H8H3_9BACI|nr:hypothetical protein [Amphibacillus marinus]SEN52405.1 hypothetical protein SAMN04488134_101279 [Amphibacillus marinus]